MARKSLLTAVRQEQSATPEPAVEVEAPVVAEVGPGIKPSRRAKMHIGGYYDPNDDTIISFQKLGIDLRRRQQDMLLEAITDFVAKHTAAKAFR